MSNNINEAILEALFITEYEKIDKFFRSPTFPPSGECKGHNKPY